MLADKQSVFEELLVKSEKMKEEKARVTKENDEKQRMLDEVTAAMEESLALEVETRARNEDLLRVEKELNAELDSLKEQSKKFAAVVRDNVK